MLQTVIEQNIWLETLHCMVIPILNSQAISMNAVLVKDSVGIDS